MVSWKEVEILTHPTNSIKLFSFLEKKGCSKVHACLWQGSGCYIALVFVFLRQFFFGCFLVFINSVLSVPTQVCGMSAYGFLSNARDAFQKSYKKHS